MITLEVKVASVMFLLRMPHFLHAFSQVGNDCSSFPSVISFSRLVTNHVLEGRVISTVHVTSDQECQMKCILSEMCDSFNLGPQTISRLYPCEILDQRSSRKVIKREQWKFRAGWCRTSPCLNGGTCFVVNGRPLCVCAKFWEGATCNVPQHKTSCSEWKALKPLSVSGFYFISPGYQRGLTPFLVYCDMTDKNGVGVTVIGHDSEKRTLVNGCDPHGCYSRDVHYLNASLLQLSSLAALSSYCEQFIKYECVGSSLLFRGWWVSHNGIKMNYWGGATPGSGKCACGMNKTCYDSTKPCNCNANIPDVMLEDSGLLTDKTALPVSQLRFGDTGDTGEQESSCSEWKAPNSSALSGLYIIAPGYLSGVTPFSVQCNSTDKDGVSVTVGSHDSEKRTSVKGCDYLGSYSREMPCLLQLRSLAATLNHCEQFVTYECDGSRLSGRGWWVSRNRTKMNCSGGAFPGSDNVHAK